MKTAGRKLEKFCRTYGALLVFIRSYIHGEKGVFSCLGFSLPSVLSAVCSTFLIFVVLFLEDNRPQNGFCF